MAEIFFVEFHQYDTYADAYRTTVERKKYKIAKEWKKSLNQLDEEMRKAAAPFPSVLVILFGEST